MEDHLQQGRPVVQAEEEPDLHIGKSTAASWTSIVYVDNFEDFSTLPYTLPLSYFLGWPFHSR